MRNEVGASICQTSDGKLVFGPWAEGTPTSVNVAVSCPPGTTFRGIYHTHPGGVPYPSDQDLKSGVQVGAETLCVKAVPGQLKCHRLGR